MIEYAAAQGLRNYSFIQTPEECTFVGCAAFIRSIWNGKILVQAPVEWYEPELRGEEEFKKWEYHIGLLGGKARYLGIKPYQGSLKPDPVKAVNLFALKQSFFVRDESTDNGAYITKDEWAQWEIDAKGMTPVEVYFNFCLLRYLWSRHLCRIVSVFYDMRQQLPKIQCLKLLQMAQWSAPGYYTTWTVFDNNIRPFCDKDNILKQLAITKDSSALQKVTAAGRPLYQGNKQIRELVLNREYKKVYDELKG